MWKNLKLRLELAILEIRGRLRKTLLGQNGLALLYETSAGLFAVDPEDMLIAQHLRETATSFNQAELERLHPFLTQDSRVLIVGAHIGCLAIPLSRLVREVVALEPNPVTCRLLEINVALNRVSNFHTHNIAAGDQRQQIPFLMNRVNSGGSKRQPLTPYLYYHDRPQIIQVESHSLDEYLSGHFDLIVLDIEGSEIFALRGMPRLLAQAQVLQVEFLPHHLKMVAGVDVATFLKPIIPHFDTLRLSSMKTSVHQSDFHGVLQELYDRQQGDNGLLFTKESALARKAGR
jgi:FkbM family methyltransferase